METTKTGIILDVKTDLNACAEYVSFTKVPILDETKCRDIETRCKRILENIARYKALI